MRGIRAPNQRVRFLSRVSARSCEVQGRAPSVSVGASANVPTGVLGLLGHETGRRLPMAEASSVS